MADSAGMTPGTVLAGNLAMLDLCRRLGFTLQRDPEDGVVAADLLL